MLCETRHQWVVAGRRVEGDATEHRRAGAAAWREERRDQEVEGRGRRRRRGDEGRPAGEREPEVDLGQGAVPVGHQPRRAGAAEEGAGGDQQAVWGPPPPPWPAAERTHSSVEHLGCHRLINFRVQSANVSLFLCFHYFSIVFFLR